MIVAISGKARAGKTTCANFLQAKYGFQKIPLAGPLKEGLNAILDVGEKPYLKHENVPFFNESWGKLLQIMGGGLREYCPNWWVYVWQLRTKDIFNHDPFARIVVDDVRYLNELEFFQEQKASIVRLERLGRIVDLQDGRDPKHSSEIALDHISDWQYHWKVADGDLAGLEEAVDNFMNHGWEG